MGSPTTTRTGTTTVTTRAIGTATTAVTAPRAGPGRGEVEREHPAQPPIG
ncbi:hypothetical protein [Saccharothrix syringae]|nr:hypothetical protein [Saccharothrix syringae]